jgi:putative tricarboxylic transport membrane protein
MYPKVDFFIGFFMVVFSTVMYIVAGKFPAAKLGLGAGDWPKLILSVLFVLGMMLAGYSYYCYRKQLRQGGGTSHGKYEKKELLHVLILCLCVAAYIRLVGLFGFILLTPFFLFALMFIFGLRKWIKMIIISVASTALVYFIFNDLLLVLLPRFTLFY